MNKIKKGEYKPIDKSRFSPVTAELISFCLTKSPDKRYSALDLFDYKNDFIFCKIRELGLGYRISVLEEKDIKIGKELFETHGIKKSERIFTDDRCNIQRCFR